MPAEPMPHYYSGCFGWPDLVRAVAAAYDKVPAQDRADTAIYANDFATAGAIDLLGPKFGLPRRLVHIRVIGYGARATTPAAP